MGLLSTQNPILFDQIIQPWYLLGPNCVTGLPSFIPSSTTPKSIITILELIQQYLHSICTNQLNQTIFDTTYNFLRLLFQPYSNTTTCIPANLTTFEVYHELLWLTMNYVDIIPNLYHLNPHLQYDNPPQATEPHLPLLKYQPTTSMTPTTPTTPPTPIITSTTIVSLLHRPESIILLLNYKIIKILTLIFPNYQSSSIPIGYPSIIHQQQYQQQQSSFTTMSSLSPSIQPTISLCVLNLTYMLPQYPHFYHLIQSSLFHEVIYQFRHFFPTTFFSFESQQSRSLTMLIDFVRIYCDFPLEFPPTPSLVSTSLLPLSQQLLTQSDGYSSSYHFTQGQLLLDLIQFIRDQAKHRISPPPDLLQLLPYFELMKSLIPYIQPIQIIYSDIMCDQLMVFNDLPGVTIPPPFTILDQLIKAYDETIRPLYITNIKTEYEKYLYLLSNLNQYQQQLPFEVQPPAPSQQSQPQLPFQFFQGQQQQQQSQQSQQPSVPITFQSGVVFTPKTTITSSISTTNTMDDTSSTVLTSPPKKSTQKTLGAFGIISPKTTRTINSNSILLGSSVKSKNTRSSLNDNDDFNNNENDEININSIQQNTMGINNNNNPLINSSPALKKQRQ